MDWNKIKHFDRTEFECPCCGKCVMNEIFVGRIDAARSIADIPFRVNSGYRCAAHNEAVGGVGNSSHIAGHAVDIRCGSSMVRFKILSALIACGFRRIGIGENFIHVDDDTSKLEDVIWTYY